MPIISKAVAQALESELARGPHGTIRLGETKTIKLVQRGPKRPKKIKVSLAKAVLMLVSWGFPEHLLTGGGLPKSAREALAARGYTVAAKARRKAKKSAKKARKSGTRKAARKTTKKRKPAKRRAAKKTTAKRAAPKRRARKGGKRKTAKRGKRKAAKKGKYTKISHTDAVAKLRCQNVPGLVSKTGVILKKGKKVLHAEGLEAERKQTKKGGKRKARKGGKRKASKKTRKSGGRKKPRSAKQRANDKKLGARARARAKK